MAEVLKDYQQELLKMRSSWNSDPLQVDVWWNDLENQSGTSCTSSDPTFPLLGTSKKCVYQESGTVTLFAMVFCKSPWWENNQPTNNFH